LRMRIILKLRMVRRWRQLAMAKGRHGPRAAKSLILKGFLVNTFTNFFANSLFLKDKKVKKNDLPPLTFDERIIILIL